MGSNLVTPTHGRCHLDVQSGKHVHTGASSLSEPTFHLTNRRTGSEHGAGPSN